jgi:hypothetical protein
LIFVSRRPKIPKQPKPICGCNHHLAFHDEDGVCHATKTHEATWGRNQSGFVVATSWREDGCECRQYVGPKPTEQYFTTQIDWESMVVKKDLPPD